MKPDFCREFCRNDNLRFICKTVTLKVEKIIRVFLPLNIKLKKEINIPVAHGEGNYFCDDRTLTELIGNNQILFTYTDNPNGSLNNIAGIQNRNRNILSGMMPHPERASEGMLGSYDGRRILKVWQKVFYK